MTSLPISILEQALVETGSSADTALAQMTTLADHAERLGLHRFWLAEHHSAPAFASVAPALLVARVAARTSTLRVGSGGVMLPNHSSAVIAEQFGTLATFDPGRIDLGVGRGQGTTDERFAAYLRRGAPPMSATEYERELEALLGFFSGAGSEGIHVPMAEAHVPQVWLLASSGAGAGTAARHGLPLSFAHHLRPAETGAALASYRQDFRPSRWLKRPYVMLSVSVVCAENDAAAAALARPADVLQARLHNGLRSHLPTPEEAAAYRFSSTETDFLRQRAMGQAQGSPETVARQLAALLVKFQPDELMLRIPVYSIEHRLRSLSLTLEHAIRPGAPVSSPQSLPT
ncbi:MsnO8 family LLM class oxidoreductase [Streptomyces flaveolus]|uniref:MsnO8 family LLM class oxidoreductase n=1 Tax=Streptomyces flaveolus TaxID=67297 RepID=UPI0033D6CCC5